MGTQIFAGLPYMTPCELVIHASSEKSPDIQPSQDAWEQFLGGLQCSNDLILL